MSPLPRASSSSGLRVLRASRLFGELDDGALRVLADASVVSELVDGDVVWKAGARATSFCVLHAGFVKIVCALADGDEDIVDIVGPRESLGDAAVLERDKHVSTAIVASARAEILRVDAVLVRDRLEHDAVFASAIGRVLLEHTRKLQEKIRVMSAGSVPQRLATLLLVLAERFGERSEDGGRRIPLSLTRGELATCVGARVETAIRCLRVWETGGVIETTKRGILVHDPAALRAVERATSCRAP